MSWDLILIRERWRRALFEQGKEDSSFNPCLWMRPILVQERESLQARASADGVLALALVHHLAIARNIPLVQVVNWLVALAPQGVIEFVPKHDPMVQQLLSFRQDIFPDYTRENFIALLKEKTVTIKSETISQSGRMLVWFKRM